LNSKFGSGSGFSSSTTNESQNLSLAMSIAQGEISTQKILFLMISLLILYIETLH
jgi:hypothetical protein